MNTHFFTENDTFGIVDPGCSPRRAACPDPTNPICATLAAIRFDESRNGSHRRAVHLNHGHTDVKELALYAQDDITKGPWSFNLGLRGDFYNGLSRLPPSGASPGVAYNIKKTNTVLRVSYARTLESPFNENLILSARDAPTL